MSDTDEMIVEPKVETPPDTQEEKASGGVETQLMPPEPHYDAGSDIDQKEPEETKREENYSIRKRIEKAELKAAAKAKAESQREIEELKRKQDALEHYLWQMTQQPATGQQETPVDAKQLVKSAISELFDERAQQEQQEEQEKIRSAQALREQEEQALYTQYKNEIINAHKRFSDFEQVVKSTGVAMTPEMVDSLKRCDDPAVIVYNAYKHHSAELQHIASIEDPIEQIKAMGRLEDRITSKITPKTRTMTPEPISSPRSNMPSELDDFSFEAIARAHDGNRPFRP